MMSEQRLHKIPTDDTSLPRSCLSFWLVEANFSHSMTCRSTTQIWVVHLIGPATREFNLLQPVRSTTLHYLGHHYLNTTLSRSSVWNFSTGSSDLFSLGNQWWCCKISVSFNSGYVVGNLENFRKKSCPPSQENNCHRHHGLLYINYEPSVK